MVLLAIKQTLSSTINYRAGMFKTFNTEDTELHRGKSDRGDAPLVAICGVGTIRYFVHIFSALIPVSL
jgi:hypothetical protein